MKNEKPHSQIIGKAEFNLLCRLQQIRKMVNEAVLALGEVRVEHKEDLVVPFLS